MVMAKVFHPVRNVPSQIPGANRQHPSALDYSEDVQDLRQHEDRPPYETVPVKICGFPNIQVMPALRGVFKTLLLNGTGSNNADIAVGGTPKIRRVYFMANTNPIWVGTQEQVKNGTGPTGALLPVGIWSPPFEGFAENVWAVATVGASTLTIREEYWAD